jgi:hypothetical protein
MKFVKMKKYKNQDWLYQQYIVECKSIKTISLEINKNPKTIAKYINKFGLNKSKLNYKEKFWTYVDKKSNNKCWEWKKSLTKTGYGKYWYNNKCHLSHRLAYIFAFGNIPQNKFVCHKCDNPKCCNPNHLFLGTPKQNTDDMIRKQRQQNYSNVLYGENHPRAKLNNNDIKEIRFLHKNKLMKVKEIAKKFNISIPTLECIIYNKTWKHI